MDVDPTKPLEPVDEQELANRFRALADGLDFGVARRFHDKFPEDWKLFVNAMHELNNLMLHADAGAYSKADAAIGANLVLNELEAALVRMKSADS